MNSDTASKTRLCIFNFKAPFLIGGSLSIIGIKLFRKSSVSDRGGGGGRGCGSAWRARRISLSKSTCSSQDLFLFFLDPIEVKNKKIIINWDGGTLKHDTVLVVVITIKSSESLKQTHVWVLQQWMALEKRVVLQQQMDLEKSSVR